jgi:hypothetical protein
MCVTDPPMKERLLLWLVFILVVTLVGGHKEEKKSKDDEDDSYDISDVRTNEVDEQDDATTRMLQLISNAAMKIVEAPDLSKVILFHLYIFHALYFVCSIVLGKTF